MIPETVKEIILKNADTVRSESSLWLRTTPLSQTACGSWAILKKGLRKNVRNKKR
jgi:hypothetical protein